MQQFGTGFHRIFPLSTSPSAPAPTSPAAVSATSIPIPTSASYTSPFPPSPLAPPLERALVYERLMALSMQLYTENRSTKSKTTTARRTLGARRNAAAAVEK